MQWNLIVKQHFCSTYWEFGQEDSDGSCGSCGKSFEIFSLRESDGYILHRVLQTFRYTCSSVRKHNNMLVNDDSRGSVDRHIGIVINVLSDVSLYSIAVQVLYRVAYNLVVLITFERAIKLPLGS